MRKKLRKIIVGVTALFAGMVSQSAEASHFQGSELTYMAIGPGIFSVQLKIYSDCSGAGAPTTATLNLKSTGCNPGRNMYMAQVGNTNIGDPFCPSVPKTCSSGPMPNYRESVFKATVTFSAAEQTCPDWIFSYTDCCRPNTANLQNNANFYAEAYVNLGTPASLINNNSPEFNPLDVVVPYINAYKPITISMYAMEPDGDSLVYSLASPLDNATASVPYANYGSILINDPDTTSTKVAIAPAGTFSATFPVHSFQVDWTMPSPITPTPYFDLNPQNGSLSFTPTAYFPGTQSSLGLNKYAFVIKIDEYRKINGQAVKVGSIRRDMLLTIMDCGPNENPVVASPVANGQSITPNTLITLRPGTPLNLTLAAGDSNGNDVLHMTSDAAQMLPGSNFSVSPGNRPTGTLVWIPTASDVRDQIYYFHVTVTDNACPLKGIQVQTFGVRVSNTGGVTGTKETVVANTSFVAYPNPFTSQVSFKFNLNKKAEKIVICNLLGQQVDQISLRRSVSGEQHVQWQNAGKHAAGIYVAKLVSENKTIQTLKFTKLQ